jgi:hypothetical protein
MQTRLNAVAQWWRNWRAARANVANLDRCGAEQTERIARDVGVSAPALNARSA